jgi:hypothetical protein
MVALLQTRRRGLVERAAGSASYGWLLVRPPS